jgi:hypothetical protein
MVIKLPGLNHLFQTAKTGSEYEYIRIEETVSPRALHAITDWILNQTKILEASSSGLQLMLNE